MSEAELKSCLFNWISQDNERVRALDIVQRCAKQYSIPQWCIAAGFVRNLVWDRLHGFELSPLNDIDLIYFCPLDIRPARDAAIEAYLKQLAPDLPWSVKNQARMHLKNQDTAYTSCADAMTYWPEFETAIGIYVSDVGECEYDKNTQVTAEQPLFRQCATSYKLVAPFGLYALFDLTLTANPRRTLLIFRQRVLTKCWLRQYPLLKLMS
ncbi:nucleotidyltransferase family protein [Shewanella glacialipiscicola]|uniref:nucleotidyltransferase family protein n=1 Tax=Shewanella glacialipiscicola TaxID=614069 RepID=UPI003D7B6D13